MMPSGTVDQQFHCPYCRKAGDFAFLFNGRNYYHCPSCDLISATQTKDIDTVIAYYRERYFDDQSGDQMSGQRTNLYSHILNILAGYKKPGSLFDLGCGCGFFLKEARERGWQVFGVDPSRQSIDHAKSLIGDGVVCGTLEDIPANRQFDAIVLVNVFDHMVDGWRQLTKIQNLLASEGILYLRLPNGLFHSFLIRFFQLFSAGQFVQPLLIFHEYAVTPKTMKRCLSDVGFNDIHVFNAPLTEGHFHLAGWTPGRLTQKILIGLIWMFFKILEKLSGGLWVWGPSFHVIARKGPEGCSP